MPTVTDWIQVGISAVNLVAILVLVGATIYYAKATSEIHKATKEQAKESAEMAKATKAQAQATEELAKTTAKQVGISEEIIRNMVRPVITIDPHSLADEPINFVTLKNVGYGPAIFVVTKSFGVLAAPSVSPDCPEVIPPSNEASVFFDLPLGSSKDSDHEYYSEYEDIHGTIYCSSWRGSRGRPGKLKTTKLTERTLKPPRDGFGRTFRKRFFIT